jgi:hypothetical protein
LFALSQENDARAAGAYVEKTLAVVLALLLVALFSSGLSETLFLRQFRSGLINARGRSI